jgi:hypothetical protein
VGSPPNIAAIARAGTSPVATIAQRILYEATDTPLWLYDAAQRVSAYYELDVIGNVRRLRAGKYAGETAGRPPLPADLGGYDRRQLSLPVNANYSCRPPEPWEWASPSISEPGFG